MDETQVWYQSNDLDGGVGDAAIKRREWALAMAAEDWAAYVADMVERQAADDGVAYLGCGQQSRRTKGEHVMPVLIGTHVHALPAPDARVTKCGATFALESPFRRPGQLVGQRTKARVTCSECRRIGSADFARADESGAPAGCRLAT